MNNFSDNKCEQIYIFSLSVLAINAAFKTRHNTIENSKLSPWSIFDTNTGNSFVWKLPDPNKKLSTIHSSLASVFNGRTKEKSSYEFSEYVTWFEFTSNFKTPLICGTKLFWLGFFFFTSSWQFVSASQRSNSRLSHCLLQWIFL